MQLVGLDLISFGVVFRMERMYASIDLQSFVTFYYEEKNDFVLLPADILRNLRDYII